MIIEVGVGLVLLGQFIYHRYIEDKPSQPRPANVALPRVDEGAPIPLIYGRVRVRSPILVWSGNYVVPGTVYQVDMLFVIGIPFDQGIGLIGNQVTGGSTAGVYAGDIAIPTLMADVSGHPGVRQWVSNQSGDPNDIHITGLLYDGRPSQDVNDNVPTGGATPSVHGAMLADGHNPLTIPGYRQQIVAFGRYSIGPSPTIPSFGFEVIARSAGSRSDLGVSEWATADDADPAAVILDLLTGTWGKLALPQSIIDIPSFAAASQTLLTEGDVPHGYSIAIEQASDGASLIRDVLRHIDGMLYQDPVTGLVVLKLIRKPSPETLASAFDINPSNMVPPGSGWYTVQGWAEQPNHVNIKFTDRAKNYNISSLPFKNQASIVASQGKPRVVDMEFLGCCTEGYASYIGARELAVVSRPLAKATVTLTRAAYTMRLGDVVTLTYPQLGIDHMQMRVVKLNRGRPGKSAITVDLMRDVFDERLGAFPPP